VAGAFSSSSGFGRGDDVKGMGGVFGAVASGRAADGGQRALFSHEGRPQATAMSVCQAAGDQTRK